MSPLYLHILLWQLRFKDFRDNLWIRTITTCFGYVSLFALLEYCAYKIAEQLGA